MSWYLEKKKVVIDTIRYLVYTVDYTDCRSSGGDKITIGLDDSRIQIDCQWYFSMEHVIKCCTLHQNMLENFPLN